MESNVQGADTMNHQQQDMHLDDNKEVTTLDYSSPKTN